MYTQDFEEITGNLPFLKSRLESNIPSRVIRAITNKVRPHLHNHCSLKVIVITKRQAQSIADQGKQSDTKGIKFNIITLIPRKYLPLDRDGNATVNAYQHIRVVNPDSTKTWRGWGNTITARLLCPISYIDQFDADPDEYGTPHFRLGRSLSVMFFSTRMKFSEGELPLNDIKGDPKFPAFLYDEDVMDSSLTAGLLRGPLLLAVSSTVLTRARGNATNCSHSGIHIHLHITLWRHR